jgi:hypothetical protein
MEQNLRAENLIIDQVVEEELAPPGYLLDFPLL